MLDSEECQHCDYGREAVDSEHVCKIVITNDEGALILLRAAAEKFPNRWDLPGGHIHIGESMEEGLRREVLEETGLVLTSPIYKVYSIEKENYYTTRLPDGKITLSHEHTDFVMVRVDGIPDNISKKFVRAIKKVL
jgi:8-oxo-dGTP pyrophosphatase MutT (NUDIX family)